MSTKSAPYLYQKSTNFIYGAFLDAFLLIILTEIAPLESAVPALIFLIMMQNWHQNNENMSKIIAIISPFPKFGANKVL